MHVCATLKTLDEPSVTDMVKLTSQSARDRIAALSLMPCVTLDAIRNYLALCVLVSKMGLYDYFPPHLSWPGE